MSQIELINIKKNYMGTEVVKGIDVTINAVSYTHLTLPTKA